MICISCCKIIHFSINITHPPPKPPPEGAPLFCFIVQGSKQNIKCKYKRTHRNEKKVCTLDCSFIKSNIDTPSYQFIIYSPRYHIYHIFLPPSQRKHTFLLSYFQCRRKNISFSLSNYIKVSYSNPSFDLHTQSLQLKLSAIVSLLILSRTPKPKLYEYKRQSTLTLRS